MKIKFIRPYRTSWEFDIIPNICFLRVGNEIRFAISILFWGIMIKFKINNNGRN